MEQEELKGLLEKSFVDEAALLELLSTWPSILFDEGFFDLFSDLEFRAKMGKLSHSIVAVSFLIFFT